MTDNIPARPAKPTSARPAGKHSIPLFKIFGIEVWLDISVLIIFSLIVFSLGNGVFASWHPDWSAQLKWGTALLSGLAFFASLLAHELSHSVVSQYFGIPVPRITLFLFGGVAEISREPDKPMKELFIALAGPLMSLLIAAVCSYLALALAGDDMDLLVTLEEGSVEGLAMLGPIATSLLWLGSINLLLAIFNMIPGFPMDGGRVFRALIWAVTGDQLKATLWASNVGRYFGWFLMAMGVLGLFQGQGLSSLWSILIGWFIANLASMSYRQLLIDKSLKGFRVRDLMRTQFQTVSPGLEVESFIEQHLLRSNQRLWPVIEDGVLLGAVSLSQISHLDPARRSYQTLGEVMSPLGELDYLAPDTHARDAIEFLLKKMDEPVMVVQHEKVVGLIQHADLVKWISLHGVLEE